MPRLELSISYGKNNGLIFSPSELLEQYLHGISICTRDGRAMSQEAISEKIRSAQKSIEQYLSIKLNRQVIQETRDFIRTDYKNWGFFKLTYPVREVLDLTGFISTTKQVEFPKSWLSSKITSEEDLLFRTVHVVPAGSDTTNTNSVVFIGITPNAGFFGVQNIPNYWNVKYCTGFKVIPSNLRDAVGKLATIQVLAVLGDILLGAGIASQSLSFDGLSQSISTTQSAENSAYSARIKQYAEELKKEMPKMKDWYKGIQFMSM